MSHPQPPQRQPTVNETARYAKALHNTALICLFACPAIALIPPRKLDLFTFGLAGTTLFSASYLLRESTGRSIIDHITGAAPVQPSASPVQAELRQRRQEDLRKPRERDWAVERQEEVRDALDVGKGFGDMIMDQIKDVWRSGKKDEE